ncbi:MAG: helix-turn-helix transcriptional regulator [Oscillospiraceae bacterium]|nr:helix-turn-helix transcriptional regulator [Oscillospiraceae bacterium]
MKLKDAIVKRIFRICSARGMMLNELAARANITPSTLYSMVTSARRDVTVSTVKKLIDGLDMGVPEFFDDPLFEDLEQELR